MKTYIVDSNTVAQCNTLLKIYKWCTENFGEQNYLNDKWDMNWHDAANNIVKFVFYDDVMATHFILIFGNKVTTLTNYNNQWQDIH